jgi:hypothetical protein
LGRLRLDCIGLGNSRHRRDRLHHDWSDRLECAAVDAGHQPEHELADPVGLLVHAF